MARVVLDTNVFVAATLSQHGASRHLVRLCLTRACQNLMGDKLLAEYEDVLSRPKLWARSKLSAEDREALLDAVVSQSEWVRVSFLWRPNLPDEADNHVIELAIAGGAEVLITHNVRDFLRGELRFPQVRIQTPVQFLADWRRRHGNDDRENA